MAKDIGPVEILVVGFPGNQFTGEVAPALAELVQSGLIRVIDLVFVAKDADGNVVGIELSDIDPAVSAAFQPHVEEPSGLLAEEDIEDLGADLPPNSSAAILAVRAPVGHQVPRRGARLGWRAARIDPDPQGSRRRSRRRELNERTRDASTRTTDHADRGDRRHRRGGVGIGAAPPAAEVRRAGRRGAAAGCGSRSTRPSPAAAPEPDMNAELTQLAQLHQQGILTDEEFSAKKAQILGI